MILWSSVLSIIWNDTNTFWDYFIEIWSSSINVLSNMPISIGLVFSFSISIVPECGTTLSIKWIWSVRRIMLTQSEPLVMICWSRGLTIVRDNSNWLRNNLVKIRCSSILVMSNMPVCISLIFSFTVTIVPESWTTLSVKWIWPMWWIMSMLLMFKLLHSNSTCSIEEKCLN